MRFSKRSILFSKLFRLGASAQWLEVLAKAPLISPEDGGGVLQLPQPCPEMVNSQHSQQPTDGPNLPPCLAVGIVTMLLSRSGICGSPTASN